MTRIKKGTEKGCQKPDYALLLDNLYTALYRKNDNPYTFRGNVFGCQSKLAGDSLHELLNKARVHGIPFMPYKEFHNILNGHAVSTSNDIFSGSQERFLLSHLGGWRSEENTLSELKNPLFHDNSRGAGTVRSEFARDLSAWMCRPNGDGYTFFQKNDPMAEVDLEKTVYMSEYIAACNYQLVSGHCLDKDGLRLILGNFTEHMLDAEVSRNKQGKKSLVKKNREALDC